MKKLKARWDYEKHTDMVILSVIGLFTYLSFFYDAGCNLLCDPKSIGKDLARRFLPKFLYEKLNGTEDEG